MKRKKRTTEQAQDRLWIESMVGRNYPDHLLWGGSPKSINFLASIAKYIPVDKAWALAAHVVSCIQDPSTKAKRLNLLFNIFNTLLPKVDAQIKATPIRIRAYKGIRAQLKGSFYENIATVSPKDSDVQALPAVKSIVNRMAAAVNKQFKTKYPLPYPDTRKAPSRPSGIGRATVRRRAPRPRG